MSAFSEGSSPIFGATPRSTLPRKEIRSVFNEQSKERIRQLCDLIAKEQDQRRFSLLIAELNQLLEKLPPTRQGDAQPVPVAPPSIPPDPPGDPE